MTIEEKILFSIKIIAIIITIAGVLIGLWKFNKQQQFQTISKFKEFQAVKYREATETISYIIYSEAYDSIEFKQKLMKFWQLYWVELSAVEDNDVEATMKDLGDHLETLIKRDFKDVTENEKKSLHHFGYSVAQAIKRSSKTWSLPEGFKK
jgi:hypothetical protein